MNSSKQPIIRVSDADESAPKVDFAYIDRKYKEWLIRRGFDADEGNALGMRRSKSARFGKKIHSDEHHQEDI